MSASRRDNARGQAGEVGKDGMTLRDYFAAKSMQGICAHPDCWGLLDIEIAHRAYTMADAMLKAREVSTGEQS